MASSQRAMRRFLQGSVVLVGIGALGPHFVGFPVLVSGVSMQPALNPSVSEIDGGVPRSDLVWTNTWSTNILKKESCRGDIVAFADPADPSRLLVKRVVGLPGEVVLPRLSRFSSLSRRDAVPPSDGGQQGEAYDAPVSGSGILVPHGHYWVEGDNAHASRDSNMFGPIDAGLIVGRVTHVFWPLHRMHVLRSRPSVDWTVPRERLLAMRPGTEI